MREYTWEGIHERGGAPEWGKILGLKTLCVRDDACFSTLNACLPFAVSLHCTQVIEKYGKELPSRATTHPDMRKQFIPSVFPPTAEEAEWMHLDRCVRVYPQQQNTGGFFICAFQKTAAMTPKEAPSKPAFGKSAAVAAETEPKEAEQALDAAKESGPAAEAAPTETVASTVTATPGAEDAAAAAVAAPPQKMSMHGYKEDPYIFLGTDGHKYWPKIKEFYGFSDDFPARNLFSRSAGDIKRHMYGALCI